MALFSSARVLALKYGLQERSTRDRLLAAKSHLDVGDEMIGNLIEAHRILLDTILRQQLRDLESGLALTNGIIPGELTGLQRDNLRWALDQIPLTTNLLGTPPTL